MPLGRQRGLLLLLHRHIAERAENAGQTAIVIAFGMGAVFDVDEVPILRDHPRFAMDFFAGAGAAQRILDVGAILGMNQCQPGTAVEILQRVPKQDLQAAGR